MVFAVELACPKTSIEWVKQAKMSPKAMNAIRINISRSFLFKCLLSRARIDHRSRDVAARLVVLNSSALFSRNGAFLCYAALSTEETRLPTRLATLNSTVAKITWIFSGHHEFA
jgi:hypothetical protein